MKKRQQVNGQYAHNIPALLDETPISFYPNLARVLGVNEAIVLQQIWFYVNVNRENESERHHIDGKWWVYNSYKQWAKKFFPWLTARGVQSIILNLEKLKVLESMQGVEDKYDRRKWYTVDRDALTKVMQDADSADREGHSAKSALWEKQTLHTLDVQNLHEQKTENTTETTTESLPAANASSAHAVSHTHTSADMPVNQSSAAMAETLPASKQSTAQTNEVLSSPHLPISPAEVKAGKVMTKTARKKGKVKYMPDGSERHFTREECIRLVEELGAVTKAPAVGTDWSLYTDVGQDLVCATIPVEEFKAFFEFCEREANGLYKITVPILRANGRPSRYAAWRSNQSKTAISGVLAVSQAATPITPSQIAYNPQNDPSYRKKAQ